jgi:hypothetical protein
MTKKKAETSERRTAPRRQRAEVINLAAYRALRVRLMCPPHSALFLLRNSPAPVIESESKPAPKKERA